MEVKLEPFEVTQDENEAVSFEEESHDNETTQRSHTLGPDLQIASNTFSSKSKGLSTEISTESSQRAYCSSIDEALQRVGAPGRH